MRSRQGVEFETYHLTCPVCAALPGTSCIDEEYQEMPRIHPSRRMSIAERNRRTATGWEPPELAERRAREHQTKAVRGALFDPRLRSGVTAVLQGRKPGSEAEPRRGPWGTGAQVPEARRSPEAALAEGADPDPRIMQADVSGWLARYLSQYPQGVAVPRQVLRDIADEIWIDAGNNSVLASRARRARLLMEGRRASANRGRRSSQKLAAHLRSFEDLGLVRRDNARDAIVIIDPNGLRRLGDAPACAGQDPTSGDGERGSADCPAAVAESAPQS